MFDLFTIMSGAVLDFLGEFISSDFGIICIVGSVLCLCVWRPLMSVIKL